MKLFDVEWTNILRDLPRWTALPFPARRILLDELKPNGYVPAHRFGGNLDAIIASGIPEVDEGHTRLWLGGERRELLKVLRAMGRHQLFDDPTRPELVRYMEEHFTNTEIELLGSDGYRSGRYVNRHTLAPRVEFVGWAGDLLDAATDEARIVWGTARGVRVDAAAIPILADLQQLARELLDAPDGMALSDLVTQRRDDDMFAFAQALHMGLGTLILFAGMRGNDLEPMVGLWPPAARELTRPPAQPPTAVVPAERFALAVQMEDMTTVLAAIVAAPVRLRAGDLAVFARAQSAIEGRLVRLPHWAAHLFANPQRSRVDEAAKELEMNRFVQIREHRGNPHLESTPAGTRWLALSPHDRLAALIDPLRKSKEMNPRGAYDAERATSFFSYALPYVQMPKSLQLRVALTDAFLGSADGFVPLTEFLDYATREANPFLTMSSSPGMDHYRLVHYGSMGDPRESYRNVWGSMLSHFLVNRLIGFGGASIGRLENGALCFALTDIGRYLLGAAESFVYGGQEVADVVIQPNFDVVFLGAAPSVEATLARFAERAGVAPGLTFRITRKSVLGAAESGATAVEVLGALTRASSKPVPRNVEREIVGWMAAVRRARLRVAELLEGADEESAARIATLLGAKARRLTGTIFELSAATPSARAAIVKKLRAGGVFIEDSTGRAATQSKRVRPGVRFADPEDFEDDWDAEE